MVLRFGNSIFEPFWNRHYIDHVQLTVAESIGVEKRGGYFERRSARDMVQNHMLQLCRWSAMEPPVEFEANAVRDEKVKVLRGLRPVPSGREEQMAVRGQYADGRSRRIRPSATRKEASSIPTRKWRRSRR